MPLEQKSMSAFFTLNIFSLKKVYRNNFGIFGLIIDIELRNKL